MDKLDKIVVNLLRFSMVLSLGGFVYLLITDENFKNGGQMAVCLGFFWFFFYIASVIEKATKDKEENPVPKEGRLIRLTWLKHCRNVSCDVPNPYIGMTGRVRNLRPDGSFDLQCDTCWLIVATEYKFEYLD